MVVEYVRVKEQVSSFYCVVEYYSFKLEALAREQKLETEESLILDWSVLLDQA